MTEPIMYVAWARVLLNRSTIQATAGSIRPIAEVHAAKARSTKNTVEKKTPPAIWPNASGNVSKTSPGPSPGSRALANTSGNIASPARIAIAVSAVTTAADAKVIDVSSGR